MVFTKCKKDTSTATPLRYLISFLPSRLRLLQKRSDFAAHFEPAEEYEQHNVYRKIKGRSPDHSTARELLVTRSFNLGRMIHGVSEG